MTTVSWCTQVWRSCEDYTIEGLSGLKYAGFAVGHEEQLHCDDADIVDQ